MEGKTAFVGVAALALVLAGLVVSQSPPTPSQKPMTTRVETAPLSPIELELRQYYASSRNAPQRWRESLQALKSGEQSLREQSAKYLTELFTQAFADERSGSATWRQTPYWGGGAENPAHDLRDYCLRVVAKSPGNNAETVSVLDWYLQNEVLPDAQVKAAETLCRIDHPKANEIVTKHIQQAHANSVVLVKLIDTAADRKLNIGQEWLAPLCLNHRISVRTAARKLYSQLGFPDPGPFDPVAAIQQEEFRELMQRISKYVLAPAPPAARLVKVTETIYYPYFDEPRENVHTGWVISKKDKQPVLVIQTPYGWRETYPFDGNSWLDFEETKHEISVQDYSVEEEVERLVELRRTGDPKYELSEGGPFTGQFEGHGAGLYETLFGDWLYRAGRFESAARILLPALETLYRDEDLVELVKHSLGQNYGNRMLVAFAGDRDYDETLRWAKALSSHFPDTQFHNYASRLADQIPQRRGDFKSFRLPTPDEWANIRSKLSRREQIDYLCQRMRLLNCFQGGQPGWIIYFSPQYAEPSGMRRDASIGHYLGKTQVINPFEELSGPYWKEANEKGLDLTVADIAQLAKYLRDDWFILAVGFWRDFHPSRTLKTTREVFASLINGVAHQKLCDVSSMERMNAQQIDEEIARIANWSRKNASLTETELLLKALESTLATEEGRWYDIEEQAKRLSELREKRAIPLLKMFLERDNTSDYSRAKIMRCWHRIKGLAPYAD